MAEPDAVPQKSRASRIAGPKKRPHPLTFTTSSAMRLMSSLRFTDPSSNLGIAGCSRTLSARLSIAVFVLSKNPLCRNSRF